MSVLITISVLTDASLDPMWLAWVSPARRRDDSQCPFAAALELSSAFPPPISAHELVASDPLELPRAAQELNLSRASWTKEDYWGSVGLALSILRRSLASHPQTRQKHPYCCIPFAFTCSVCSMNRICGFALAVGNLDCPVAGKTAAWRNADACRRTEIVGRQDGCKDATFPSTLELRTFFCNHKFNV